VTEADWTTVTGPPETMVCRRHRNDQRGSKWLPVLAGLAAMLAVGTVVLWPRSERISPDNFARIRDGMTLEEAKAILGEPGDFTTGPADGLGLFECCGKQVVTRRDENTFICFWISDTTCIDVVFDDASGATPLRKCDPVSRVPQSGFDYLLSRAKRQWHRWFSE
jgi:hypothetical protein